MNSNPQFLSAQEVRISIVLKPRLKIHCTAAEWKQSISEPKTDKKKDRKGKKTEADEGGVITERMNKRKEMENKTKKWRNRVETKYDKRKRNLSESLSLSLSFYNLQRLM